MALSGVRWGWTLARKVEDLLGLHREVREALSLVDQRLRALEDRMTRLEARQEQIFTEARNTAAVMAGAVISETVTRITRLEGRTDQIEQQQRRLPPPAATMSQSIPAWIGPVEFGTLGRMVTARCPSDLAPVVQAAGGAWESGAKVWLVDRRGVGPLVRALRQRTDPLFRSAGLVLDQA